MEKEGLDLIHRSCLDCAGGSSSATATHVHVRGVGLAPRDRVWHPSKQLLYVDRVVDEHADADDRHTQQQVRCQQFTRNRKHVVVAANDLLHVPVAPLATPEFVWMLKDSASYKMVPYNCCLQTVLEDAFAAWHAGSGPHTVQITRKATGGGYGCLISKAERDEEPHVYHVDVKDMIELNYNSGGRVPIMRRRVLDGPALPLSILEIERAVDTGAHIQVRNKGAGRVLFVMDQNAKVEFLDAAEQAVHCTKQCDACGVLPIRGHRYHKHGHDYDLCATDFGKLAVEEKRAFHLASAEDAQDVQDAEDAVLDGRGRRQRFPCACLQGGTQCNQCVTEAQATSGIRLLDLTHAQYRQLPKDEKLQYESMYLGRQLPKDEKLQYESMYLGRQLPKDEKLQYESMYLGRTAPSHTAHEASILPMACLRMSHAMCMTPSLCFAGQTHPDVCYKVWCPTAS